jgi:hypothetical protein
VLPAGELVDAVPDSAKASVAADGVGGEGFLDGVPAQRSFVEPGCCGLNFDDSHRPVGLLEDEGGKLEHRWSSGWPVARLPGLFSSGGEELLLKLA